MSSPAPHAVHASAAAPDQCRRLSKVSCVSGVGGSPRQTDVPKRRGRRSSGLPAQKASLERSQHGILQTIFSRRRSGASEANLIGECVASAGGVPGGLSCGCRFGNVSASLPRDSGKIMGRRGEARCQAGPAQSCEAWPSQAAGQTAEESQHSEGECSDVACALDASGGLEGRLSGIDMLSISRLFSRSCPAPFIVSLALAMRTHPAPSS